MPVTVEPLLVRDGWYPRLQYPFVLTGFGTVNLLDLRQPAAKRVVYAPQGRAFPAGWLDERVAAYTLEGTRDQRQMWIIEPGLTTPVRHHDWQYMGNNPVAAEGHTYWCGLHGLYIDAVQVNAGRFLPQSPRGGPGGRVTVIEIADPRQRWFDYPCWLLQHGKVTYARIVPKTDQSNVWQAGAEDYLTYGYFGRTWLVTPATGAEEEITITPWQRESPPLIVDLGGVSWALRATEHPRLGPGVLYGTVRLADPIGQVWNLAAVWLDAQWVDRTLYIVSNDARGNAHLTTISEDFVLRWLS